MAAPFVKSRLTLALLALCLLLGLAAWLRLHFSGLAASGLTREAFWGLFAGQAVFCLNAAAGAMALLSVFYLRNGPGGKAELKAGAADGKAAGRFFSAGLYAAACGFLAGAAFMFADLGRPRLLLELFLRPAPAALYFWLAVLPFLCLAAAAGLARLAWKRHSLGLPLPARFRGGLIFGLALALALLLAQALYFQSFPGRAHWQGAGLSARLWASALAAGAAGLLLVGRIKPAGRRAGETPPEWRLRRFLTGALALGLGLNALIRLLDLFAAFYGGDVGLARSHTLLFTGDEAVSWFNFPLWLAVIFELGALLLLPLAAARKNRALFAWVLAMALLAGWVDKSLALPLGGLAPGAAGYVPSGSEILFSLGVYAAALLVFRRLSRALFAGRG